MADSLVYREAVNRLKRLLYDMPLEEEKWRTKYIPPEENCWKKSFPKESDVEGHSSTIDAADLKHFKTIDRGDSAGEKDHTTKILLSMLKRQEGLLDDLEGRNFLLKDELMTAAEAAKEIARQNEELRYKLKDSILQMEPSPQTSSRVEAEAEQQEEKRQEIITCLKDEKEQLMEMVRLQDDNISSLRLRETQALDKIRQALCLAEDSQEASIKAKEKEDSAIEDLKNCVSKMSLEGKEGGTPAYQDEAFLNLHDIITRLRKEKSEEETRHRKREMELEKRLQLLQNSLKDSEEGKQRIEKLVMEQRNAADDAFKRMDALLDKRNTKGQLRFRSSAHFK